MKRYKKLSTTIPQLDDNGFGSIEIKNDMVEDDTGEWVKYEDMKKEMKRIWGDIMPPPSEMLKP